MAAVRKQFVLVPRHGQRVDPSFTRGALDSGLSAPFAFAVAPFALGAAMMPAADVVFRTNWRPRDGEQVRPVRTLRSGGYVIETTNEMAQGITASNGPFVVEEVKYLYPAVDVARISPFKTIDLGTRPRFNRVNVRVRDSRGEPVANAAVLLFNELFPTPFEGRTDDQGLATVRIIGEQFHMVVVPFAGYWDNNVGTATAGPAGQRVEVTLRTLEVPETFDWGHFAMETHLVASRFQGDGVTVGVVDTAVQADHEDLEVAGGENLVAGDPEDSWRDDPEQHGTHCAGIACAQDNTLGITGHAPKATLRAYKVFPAEGGGAASPDIADAIDAAIADGVDLINMSLGYAHELGESIVITQAIERAFDAGIICCIATGNDNGLVGWPAAAKVENIVRVGAIGQFGTYPDDSLHKTAETTLVSQDGRFVTTHPPMTAVASARRDGAHPYRQCE
jgi:hypothetical protein